jgi:hypothetical protein
MSRAIVTIAVLLLPLAVRAQDAVKSGLPKDAVLKAPFHAYTVNGPNEPGRHHCLICEYGLDPVVLIFAREHPDGNYGALPELLQRLEKAGERYQDSFLRPCVVFLSAEAQSSVAGPKLAEPAAIVKQAQARDELIARLKERSDKLKHVVIAIYPDDGPEGYGLAKDADVTILLYVRHRVVHNYAYRTGGLTEKAVDEILKGVDELVGRARAKQPPAKGAQGAGKDTAAAGWPRRLCGWGPGCARTPTALLALAAQRCWVCGIVDSPALVGWSVIRTAPAG